MKKLLAVLLALGLIVAFASSASAADVKLSGYYFIVGQYINSNSLGQNAEGDAGPHNAFYWQKLRFNPVMQIADGLKVTFRIDAHTGYWGDTVDGGGRVGKLPGYGQDNRNIRWRRTYIDANLGYGMSIRAGVTQGGTFGTIWCDGAYDEGRIYLFAKAGPGSIVALTAKAAERDAYTTNVDADYDKYALGYLGKVENIEFGALWYWLRHAAVRATSTADYHVPMAYMKGTFGPLYVEAEWNYMFGKDVEYFDPYTGTDIDRGGMSAYVKAQFNMGPAYVGGQFGWLQGNDPDTTDKNEAGYPGNVDYDPCLILWNSDYADSISGYVADGQGMGTYGRTDGNISNAWIAQVFGGFSPMEKLELFASATWAKADEKPLNYVDDDYGYEFDVTATYKIYDNLEYMVGFGYFVAGDYYKGTNASADVENNYLVINKLTLNF